MSLLRGIYSVFSHSKSDLFYLWVSSQNTSSVMHVFIFHLPGMEKLSISILCVTRRQASQRVSVLSVMRTKGVLSWLWIT